MSDYTKDTREAAPERIAKMLGLATGPEEPWHPEELRSILAQQLTAPLPVDLGSMLPPDAARLSARTGADYLLLKSLGDLLQHAHPPVDLLRMAKNFAKSHVDHPDSPLPSDVAKVLYYAAIAAAVRRGERISRLGIAEQRRAYEWAMGQSWVPEPLRSLFREGVAQLQK